MEYNKIIINILFSYLYDLGGWNMGKKKEKEDSKAAPQKRLPEASSSSEDTDNKKNQDLKKTSEDFFIVGIGASAGGLDAMENFFKNMPQESGMAFVIITHLSPNQESILPELIKKNTPMHVLLAEEGIRIWVAGCSTGEEAYSIAMIAKECMDEKFNITFCNNAFYQTFGLDSRDTRGKSLFEICAGEWDIPRLRQLLEQIIPDNWVLEAFEVEHDFQTIGRKRMILNARGVQRMRQKNPLILLAIEYITGLTGNDKSF